MGSGCRDDSGFREGCPAPPGTPGRSYVVLGFGDVPRLRPLRAVDDLEFDRLTLFQGPETVATDCRVVDEYVAATLALNETVALGVVEPLDLACNAHRSSSLLAIADRPAGQSRGGRVRPETADELRGTKKDRECLRGLDFTSGERPSNAGLS